MLSVLMRNVRSFTITFYSWSFPLSRLPSVLATPTVPPCWE